VPEGLSNSFTAFYVSNANYDELAANKTSVSVNEYRYRLHKITQSTQLDFAANTLVVDKDVIDSYFLSRDIMSSNFLNDIGTHL